MHPCAGLPHVGVSQCSTSCRSHGLTRSPCRNTPVICDRVNRVPSPATVAWRSTGWGRGSPSPEWDCQAEALSCSKELLGCRLS